MTYTVAATQEMRTRFAARFGGELAARLEFRTINGGGAHHRAVQPHVWSKTRRSSSAMRARPRHCSCGYGRTQNHEYPAESTVKDLRTAITYIKNMCLTDAELDELETDIENLPDL